MKKTLMKIIIHLVFFAVFNMIFFFEGVEHTNASWCSYGFATFAYLCLCATPIFAKGSSSAVLIGSLWIQSTTFFLCRTYCCYYLHIHKSGKHEMAVNHPKHLVGTFHCYTAYDGTCK